MTRAPDITVSELRAAIGRILDAVEERFGEDLRFAGDYYWALPAEEAFAVYDKPELELIGQVSDDTLSVREFLAQPSDEHVLIEHECEHFRGVLQAIEHLDITPTWEAEPIDTAGPATPCRRHRRWWHRLR